MEEVDDSFTRGVGVSVAVAWDYIIHSYQKRPCLSPRVSAEGALFLLETRMRVEWVAC